MEKKYLILLLIGFLLIIGFVSAVYYPEPWGNDVNENDNSLTGVDHVNFNGGGYIYSNSTTLILGHS